MKRQIEFGQIFAGCMLVALMCCGVQASAGFSIQLKVTDRNGEPVRRFEVLCHTHVSGWHPWKEGRDGELTLHSGARDLPFCDGFVQYQLIVRADGYAPEVVRVNKPIAASSSCRPLAEEMPPMRTASDENSVRRDCIHRIGAPELVIKREVALAKSVRRLVLKCADGRAVPESLKPVVVLKEFWKRAVFQWQTREGRHRTDLNMTSLKPVGAGEYTFGISEQTPAFYVCIDHPGFLRAFIGGPFHAEDFDDGTLEVKLPRPAVVWMEFEPPAVSADHLPFEGCAVSLGWMNKQIGVSYPVLSAQADEPRLKTPEEYLAPGQYWVYFYTRPAKAHACVANGGTHAGAFRDSRKIAFEQGQQKTIAFQYEAYDKDAYQGDYSATVTVRRADGSVVSDVPYRLFCSIPHYGSTVVQEGVLDENGQLELAGVKGGDDAVRFRLQMETEQPETLRIQLDGRRKKQQIECRLAPTVGDMAPDMTIHDMFSQQNVKLSDFSGRIVFIEFWNTPCGFCKEPMGKLCEVQARRGSDWDDRVVLLSVSIDAAKQAVVDHVRHRGWTGICHTWCNEGGTGFDSRAAKAYGLNGVPTALLIDRQGRIVWRGNPRDIDVEAKVDALLTGANRGEPR